MSENGTSIKTPDSIAGGSFLKLIHNISRNTLAEELGLDLTLEEALALWEKEHVPEDQHALFQQLFSLPALREAFAAGKRSVSFDYDDPRDPLLQHRLTLHLLNDEDSGDIQCIGKIRDEQKSEEEKPADEAVLQSPYRAVIRSYILFAAVPLDRPTIHASHLLRDEQNLAADVALPCPYSKFLKAVAAKWVRSAWADEFLALFSLESLKNAVGAGKATLQHSFSSDTGAFRMDAYLPEAGADDRTCYLALAPAPADSGNGLTTLAGEEGRAAAAAMEDLRIEMEMERAETRKKHRRGSFLLIIFTVIVGLLGGAMLYQRVPEVSSFLNRFLPLEATATPVPEPTPTPVIAETPETVTEYVVFTSPKTFTADIMENGTSRMSTSSENFEAVSVTVSVPEVLTPEDFAKLYAKSGYTLDGSESAVHLSITYTSDGSTASLIPEDAFLIRLTDADGNVLSGYQLMDQPMGGSYAAAIASGVQGEYYKRYPAGEDARYLLLTYYQDGVQHDLYFALRYDDPNVAYEELKSGDKGPFVTALKAKLVELGFLNAKKSGNAQYNKDTEQAVKAAQEHFGLEQTGIADTAFLKRLYRTSVGNLSSSAEETAAPEESPAADGGDSEQQP